MLVVAMFGTALAAVSIGNGSKGGVAEHDLAELGPRNGAPEMIGP